MQADGGEAPGDGGWARHVLLLLLAAGAGVVDAVSLTTLGVFTAAVTANIVLLGLALGDADPHTAARAGLGVVGFIAGVLVAARLLERPREAKSPPSRAAIVLMGIAAVQAVFVACWVGSDGDPKGVMLDALTATSAVAMGGQTSVARLWHPGVPPTYVSGALTLLLSDLARSGSWRPDTPVRVGVVAAIAAGATLGALMLSDANDVVPVVPLGLTTLAAIGTAMQRGDQRAPSQRHD